eukprot:346254-Pelagomonas_calceolata.AAC.2
MRVFWARSDELPLGQHKAFKHAPSMTLEHGHTMYLHKVQRFNTVTLHYNASTTAGHLYNFPKQQNKTMLTQRKKSQLQIERTQSAQLTQNSRQQYKRPTCETDSNACRLNMTILLLFSNIF